MASTTSLSNFDCIQTFYINPSAVGSSSEVFLTSVELFFKRKNKQGPMLRPGAVVAICEVDNDIPNLNKIISNSITRVPFERIYTSTIDATLSTSFIFNRPLVLKTDRFYGVVINFEDPSFELWHNKIGNPFVGTNTPSSGVNSARDGKFFNGTAGSPTQPVNDVTLKYKINIARFTSNTVTAEIVNRDFEYFTVSNVSGDFILGEPVFKKVANSVGTLSFSAGNSTIIGTGTSFENLQIGQSLFVLASANESNTVMYTVDTIVSNTNLIVKEIPLFSNSAASFKISAHGTVYSYDKKYKKLYLDDSNANSSVRFVSGDSICGVYSKTTASIASVDNLRVDRFVPSIRIDTPAISVSENSYAFSYSDNGNFVFNNSVFSPFKNDNINDVARYEGYIISRSNEVNNSYLFDTAARKSAAAKITFNINRPTAQLFTTPYISSDGIDFYIHQNRLINSTYTTLVNGVVYDTEVDKNGLALSKHITTKVSFANNRFAEDVRVYANIYRPVGTDVRMYCKIHNSADPETFDDKQWTPLEVIENGNQYSSSEKQNDYIEVAYGIPQHADIANTVPGTFTAESGNAVLLCTNNSVNTYITSGDVVKVYKELFPQNYFITPVVSSNTTTITIGSPQTNNSILGKGLKVAKLKYKYTAFTNPQNDNICSYYNNNLGQFDKFNSMQIKIVMLSDQPRKYPKVNDISVIGVSA